MGKLRVLAWGGAALALLVAAAALVMVIAGDRIATSLIESRGSAAIGRPLQFARLKLAWGSPLRLSAENVRVSGPDIAAPPIFAADRVEAELDTLSLLRLRLDVRRLRVEQPFLQLEIAEDGRRNWEDMFPRSNLDGGPVLGRLADLGIQNGRIHFRDRSTGAAADAVIEEAGVSEPGGPIRVAAHGTFGREAFALTAQATLAPVRGGGPARILLQGHLGGNHAAAEGEVSDLALRRLDLRVDMVGDDLQRLLATLGVPIPQMPIYALAGRVVREGVRWRVEGMSGRVGGSDLSGEIAVDEANAGRVPYIRAALTAKQLDLFDLKGLYGGEPNRPVPSAAPKRPADPTRRVIPDTELPVEHLQRFNADLSLVTEHVKPPLGLGINRLEFKLSLDGGTMTLEELRLGVGGGEVSGRAQIRSRQSPVTLEAALDARRVDLRRLFARAKVAKGMKELAGLLGGAAKLRSTGTTQREILAKLAGEASLSLRDGQLGNFAASFVEADFLEALQRFLGAGPSPSPTATQARPIRCLVARFRVEQGVATAAPLLVELLESVVAGHGNINLGDETLFLDVRPYAKKESKRPIGVPFHIRGTFADPTITSDKPGFGARVGAALGLDTVEIPAEVRPFLEARQGDPKDCDKRVPVSGHGSSAPR